MSAAGLTWFFLWVRLEGVQGKPDANAAGVLWQAERSHPAQRGRAPPQAVRISLLAVSVEFASKYIGGICRKTKRYVEGVQDVKADAGLHHEGRWSVGTHYQGVQMHEIQYDRSVKCCTANACNSAWA